MIGPTVMPWRASRYQTFGNHAGLSTSRSWLAITPIQWVILAPANGQRRSVGRAQAIGGRIGEGKAERLRDWVWLMRESMRPWPHGRRVALNRWVG